MTLEPRTLNIFLNRVTAFIPVKLKHLTFIYFSLNPKVKSNTSHNVYPGISHGFNRNLIPDPDLKPRP